MWRQPCRVSLLGGIVGQVPFKIGKGLLGARIAAIGSLREQLRLAGIVADANNRPCNRNWRARACYLEAALAVNVGARPALKRPGGEASDIGADIEDHRPRRPVRHLILPAQNLLDVSAHSRWTLDVHRGHMVLRQSVFAFASLKLRRTLLRP